MCLGIPGQVERITDESAELGIVNVAGVRREVNLSCVVTGDHSLADCIGDWVLVHVGFAMSRIDDQEAARTLALLEELGEMEQELGLMSGAGDDRSGL